MTKILIVDEDNIVSKKDIDSIVSVVDVKVTKRINDLILLLKEEKKSNRILIDTKFSEFDKKVCSKNKTTDVSLEDIRKNYTNLNKKYDKINDTVKNLMFELNKLKNDKFNKEEVF